MLTFSEALEARRVAKAFQEDLRQDFNALAEQIIEVQNQGLNGEGLAAYCIITDIQQKLNESITLAVKPRALFNAGRIEKEENFSELFTNAYDNLERIFNGTSLEGNVQLKNKLSILTSSINNVVATLNMSYGLGKIKVPETLEIPPLETPIWRPKSQNDAGYTALQAT